ncbi:hypothetical protein NEMBOFW57_010754 [Staphylotrichum longicolle]|uniref:Carboxylesterase type B domain-containing protein n=1 Tax=Staphylotrichum longicolle TaxID=669026 RepID=A0AAD4ENB9_9PEZI|nr:hypothetical protein NEMBOFW57_010754 [Staphylotrichum longicolle]
MPALDAELIDSAANHVIAAHRLRICFLHLLYCLLNPEISSPMTDAYSPERIVDIKGPKASPCERKWMSAYERVKERFEEGEALLRQFEATVNKFLSIPYAVTPPRRFLPPEHLARYNEPVNATQPPPLCIQQNYGRYDPDCVPRKVSPGRTEADL